jgi:ectoine hydroxylase-related dioxygenase (phytanoyl-CoA dioxygenase family)
MHESMPPAASRSGGLDWIESYKRDGFVVLHDVLPPSLVQRLRQAADDMMDVETGRSNPDHYDFESAQVDGKPVIQRIKRPHEINPALAALTRDSAILDRIAALLGPNLRLHHSKINVKAPEVGATLEWHQDWAFIPHSNSDLAIVSMALDDCTMQSGPLMLLPGSHAGGLRNHHQGGYFQGAIDVEAEGIDTSAAVPVLGPPGTISIHHPLTIHGSGYNRSLAPRRVLFFEYAATDAWPLFYGVKWEEYEARVVRGRSTNEPRFSNTPVRIPEPRATKGMIYDIQKSFSNPYFKQVRG